MDPSLIACSAMETVLIVAGLGFRFLTRNRRSGAADPSHADGDDLQEKKVENRPSATATELAAHRNDMEHLPFPSLVPAQSGHEFEVFLSFRGKEIRQTFADCLYRSMIRVGVRTFRDNEELHVGEEIGPNLMSAIKQSKICMPIFTKGYATSKWCLREVAEMVKLMKENLSGKQVIMPIFFDVTPNDVQHQTGSYAEAFTQHMKKIKTETIDEWRDALKEVGKLKGLELSQAANGNQGEFIDLVVAEVLRKLRQAWVDMSDNVVGLDDPADAVMQMLELDLNDIRMVGIWGIGGIGKTTLATYVYNRIAVDFQCCSFLGDVRETYSKPGGLLELLNKLVDDILGKQTDRLTSTAEAINVLKNRVRCKKALILIDDVDNINQLNALAADPDWFGSGSRILVTSREKKVLNHLPWSNTYELKPLDEVLALKLLCKYAFRDDSPSPEFDDLSRDIVHATGGLPLALVVIGSSLYPSRGKEGVWEDMVDQLKRRPPMDVLENLRISYDALEAEQKEIFLDIACFFIGWNCKLVIPMWHDCKFYPILGIEVLQLKCLISIGDGNKLQMHDQLRDLGRYIVEQESSKALELRSRLWQSKEAVDVLRRQQGTPKIEGVVIWPKENGVTFSEKCFQNLSELRILQLHGDVKIDGDYQHLLPNLKLLRWSTECNHPPNLTLNNLAVLNLSGSRVDEDWIAWNSIKMEKVKVLDLSRCYRLRRIPGFSAFPKLERLVLECCRLLDSIDPSIGLLKNLNFLSLRDCSELKKLPDQLGYLEALSVLIVDWTCVEEIPISARMKKLQFLSANYCHHLKSIPNSVGSLESLKRLSLEGCSSLRKLPETIGQLKSLIDLRLQRSGITCLPKTLGNLKELQVIDAIECSSLDGEVPVEIGSLSHLQIFHLCLRRCLPTQTLPKLPSSLISLAIESSCSCGEVKKDFLAQLCNLEKLVLRKVNIRALPEEIGSFSHLKEVEITLCTKLEFLPTLPSNLHSLKVSNCCSLQKLPSLSNLRKLSELQVSHMRLREIDGLGDLISLQSLTIDDCPLTMLDGVQNMKSLRELSIVACDVERLPELCNLRRLCTLDVSYNRLLVDVQGINNLPELKRLNFSHSTSLERLNDFSNLPRLEHLALISFERLSQPKGPEKLESLHRLDIIGCKAINKLPDLSKLQKLRHLKIKCYEKLSQLDGIRELGSMERMAITKCNAIEELPMLSKLRSLVHLKMKGCKKLNQLDGLRELVSLEMLDITDCKAIEKLPELSKLQSLQELNLNSCERLIQLDGIRDLASLEILNMEKCKAIEKLPELSKLQSLQELNMTGCERLIQLDGIRELASLQTLNMGKCKAIEKLPELRKLTSLQELNMSGCERLIRLDGIEELVALETLDISDCKAIEKLPELSKLQSLQELNMNGCERLIKLDGIRELASLRILNMGKCKAIEKLLELQKLMSLQELNMSGCERLIRLDGIEELVSLETLDISKCNATLLDLSKLSKLQRLRELQVEVCEESYKLGIEELESLRKLDMSGSKAIEMLPRLSKHHNISVLYMRGCSKLRQLEGLGELISLNELDISGCTSIENIPDLAKLQKLKRLKVKACKKWRHLEGLEGLNLLKKLDISGCKAIEKLPDLSQMHELSELRMEGCEKLHGLEGLGLEELKSLRVLRISGCRRIEKLSNLSKLQDLRRLDIKACKQLRRLEGLEKLELLKELNISGCRALEKLPDLSELQNLAELKMEGCKNIREVEGLENLINLKVLRISSCKLLNLQDLSHLRSLNFRKVN